MTHASHFDPCALFPARVKKRKFTAKPISESGEVGGATDLVKGVAMLPTANNAYARTIRLHEALHAIYTPKPTKERLASGKPYTILEQALEDARLHLNCARTGGQVRRDELATAMRDIVGASRPSALRLIADKNIAALLALRSAAILTSQEDCHSDRYSKRLDAICEHIAPNYRAKIHSALERIARNEMADAARILQPYFNAHASEVTTMQSFPFPHPDKGEDTRGEGMPFADVSFEKLEGKLTSDAADLLSKSTVDAINAATIMPKLAIHPIFAFYNIPTFFGATEKHVMSGSRIDAKKLATIVGPNTPRLFTKTLRRNGGTVVIDASGSMDISPAQLLALVTNAPLATIAFYNAPNDVVLHGNLWVFAHKGKRAADFSAVKGISYEREFRDDRERWGTGNVVDFQVLQWLLAQPAPRYILTDGRFTGPYISRHGAFELLRAAIARKKLIQTTSLAETEALLRSGGKAVPDAA